LLSIKLYGASLFFVKKVVHKVGLYLAKIRSQIDGNLYLIVRPSAPYQ